MEKNKSKRQYEKEIKELNSKIIELRSIVKDLSHIVINQNNFNKK